MSARDFSVNETLRNGTVVTVRAVRSDDRQRIVDAFKGLERDSVYTRFFAYKNEISAAELAQIDTIDFEREVMLVATTLSGGREIVIGGARYIAPKSSNAAPSAEVAFTIEEDYQGQGLASRFLAHLASIARSAGITHLEADVLSGNKAMLAVFERSRLPMQTRREDGCIHVTLTLDTAP